MLLAKNIYLFRDLGFVKLIYLVGTRFVNLNADKNNIFGQNKMKIPSILAIDPGQWQL